MQLRKTLILVAVAVALVLFIVVYERGTRSTDEIEDLHGRAFPALAGRSALADAITIRRGPDKIVIVKREAGTADERWHIAQPIDYRADAAAVIGFLGTFEEARKAGLEGGALEKPLAEEDAAVYGLDKGVRVTVSAGRDRLVDALLGNLAPSEKQAYASRYSREAVFVVEDKVRDEAIKHLDGFRDKRLVDLGRGRVTNVVILEDEKPVVELARAKDGRWHVVAPVSDRADGARVGGIVDRMGSLWADRFEPDFLIDDSDVAKRLAGYGLAPARRSVKITRDVRGETVRNEILFGKRVRKTETGQLLSYDVYATLAGSRTVVLVPEKGLEAIRVSVDNLREHVVADLHADEVRSLSVSRFAGKLRLEKKEDGGWRITGPERYDADPERVERLFNELAALRVLKFLPSDTHLTRPVIVEAAFGDPAAAGAEAGAEEPEDARPNEFVFFEPGDDETIRARRGKSGAVFEVASAILTPLRGGPLYYRDRAVLRLDDERVVRLTIRRAAGGGVQSAVREGDRWKLDPTATSGAGADPAAAVEVDQFMAQEVKWALCELRAEEFAGKPSRAELARRGLEPADICVEANLAPKKPGEPGEKVVLLVGRPLDPDAEDADMRYYARLEGDPVVFLIGGNAARRFRNGFVKCQDQ